PAAPGDITLIYRARDTTDLVHQHELDTLAATHGHRVYYVLGPRAHRPDGSPSWLPATAAHLTDTQALTQLVPDLAHHDGYLCGADTWMDAARTAATAAGVPDTHIHHERFTW
ncbi:MAG: oxidoreductase, partial [Actinobacteria bacterium]|nr:oxidoreductase [Actinomycetota bacterium]